jgi:hypothetical protein
VAQAGELGELEAAVQADWQLVTRRDPREEEQRLAGTDPEICHPGLPNTGHDCRFLAEPSALAKASVPIQTGRYRLVGLALQEPSETVPHTALQPRTE